MAIEIEKKYRLTREQYAAVVESLKDLGAEFIREDFEVNELYGGGILKQEKALLRVRKINDKTILTYKKSLSPELAIKQHIEHETVVESAEAIEDIIRALGFRRGMVYEKRRQTWHLQKVEICLDELPFGLFLEIEGQMSQIALIEMMLELENFEVEQLTYPKLTAQLGVEKDQVIEARFTKKS